MTYLDFSDYFVSGKDGASKNYSPERYELRTREAIE